MRIRRGCWTDVGLIGTYFMPADIREVCDEKCVHATKRLCGLRRWAATWTFGDHGSGRAWRRGQRLVEVAERIGPIFLRIGSIAALRRGRAAGAVRHTPAESLVCRRRPASHEALPHRSCAQLPVSVAACCSVASGLGQSVSHQGGLSWSSTGTCVYLKSAADQAIASSRRWSRARAGAPSHAACTARR